VGQRIGREGAQGDIEPGDVANAQMQQGDPIVPGQRCIGDECRQARQQVAVRRDRGQACPDGIERQTPEFPKEKPSRYEDRGQTDQRPNELTHVLHEKRSDSSQDP
jgi:hypothetical protein